MVVVAIIGVLAGIAIPSWLRESRKGKFDSEVNAMLAELAVKEEAYKSEFGNGSYLTTAQCPTATSSSGINFNTTCVTVGSPWQKLAVSATDSQIRCQYQITAGAAGTVPAPPTPFTFFANPTGAWYYVVATCDMDNQGGTNTTYFRSSVDTKLQNNNYGK
jgi:Tfp pilus assembly protein PilE